MLAADVGVVQRWQLIQGCRKSEHAHSQVVWLQSGISQPAFEEAVARAGIRIIADRCLKVDRARALSHL